MGVVSILIEMLGLFGAIKEHFCLTLTYAILRMLATVGHLATALSSSSSWANFVMGVLITTLAFMLARDLNTIRRRQNMTMPGMGKLRLSKGGV